MLRNRTVLLLLSLAPLFLVTSSTAQGAAYIKFDGIDGESTDANHEGWSEILEVDHLIQHIHAVVDGQTRTHAQHSDLKFVKELDKASPKLAETCLNGFKINQVVIEFQSNFDNPFIWEKITLESVLVSGYDIQTSESAPIESFSLNYEKIHWKYVLRNSNGGAEGSFEFGWDQVSDTPFSPGINNPTPTPTPVVNPNEPTPTPIINPTDPTPTPIVGPVDPTPTPSQSGVTLGGDLLKLYEDEFKQKAVIVRELNLSQDPPGLSDIFSEQFYSMATLPDGSVITNVKKRNLSTMNDEDIPDDADVLVRISPEGEMTPFAQITSPDLLLNGESIREGEAKFLNLTFNGKDEISVLVRVNGLSNQESAPYAAVILIKISGPFDASSVGSFRVY